ncbi:hypothetical protein [Flavobacterium piscis]|uniref:Uncharacterized protein n=1 Tax=Flavobacterium piscis TaxID=1114874 RepID=A0ABU1Y716_9FLAO|nr:hypothetical protein [Flavobacterium piscis]MDR7209311.1 hypothetical protein [Flavobacterium piscis]
MKTNDALLILFLLSAPITFECNKWKQKNVEKNVKVEKKESHIEKLGYMFEDACFIDYLKIPSEHISGFKFYIVENVYAGMLLETRDRPKLIFLISELALKYNEILSSENK